ncbi:hypothetical protein [Brevibacillus sp. NRS-1366]|uniref:hypothetical protein n=1 Tax=Brevibacillus sp. NRS-1366 TaxID=3233899 RepID=UPI003D22417D
MNKKILISVVALTLSFGLIASAYAGDKGSKKALEDYKRIQLSKTISKAEEKGIADLQLSDYSIPEYVISAEDILASEGTDISAILKPTENQLWFMMNDNEAEGIIIANDKEPVLMGGKKGAKKLQKLYKELQKDITKGDKILYFEFQGGGIFLIEKSNKQDVWLSERASTILELEAYKKLKPEVVLKSMKERINDGVSGFTPSD